MDRNRKAYPGGGNLADRLKETTQSSDLDYIKVIAEPYAKMDWTVGGIGYVR